MVNKQTLNVSKALFKLPNGTYVTPHINNGGLDICDIGTALYVNEAEGYRRRLNGAKLEINDNLTEFVNRLRAIKPHFPTLFCTNDEWEEIAGSNYLNQCGRFVLNEEGKEVKYNYDIDFVGTDVKRYKGVISNWSSSSYAIWNTAVPFATSTDMDIVIKLDIETPLSSTVNFILKNTNDQPTGGGVVLRTLANTSRLTLWATTNNTSWTTNSVDTGIDLIKGVQYIKLTYNGSTVIISRSTNGVDYTAGTTITTGVITSCKQTLGGYGDNLLRGSIDLLESYVRNGEETQYLCVAEEETVAPYVRLPKVVTYTGCLDYNTLSNVGISNRALVYTEKPNAGNNFQWLNVYADGWVEQGGTWNSQNAGGTGYRTYDITFRRPYRDANYSVAVSLNLTANDVWPPTVYNKTKNSVTFYRVHQTANYSGATWFTCGWSEVPQPGEYENFESTDCAFPYFIQIANGQVTFKNIRNDWEIINPYAIFDPKYSYTPLYNASYLYSNGQWNDKTIYNYAYEALVVEADNTVQTGEIVTLPSGGKYVKRLTHLAFDQSKYTVIGNPTINSNGLMSFSNATNYIRMPISYASINTSNSFSLKFLMQFKNNSRIVTMRNNEVSGHTAGFIFDFINNKITTYMSFANTAWDINGEVTEKTFTEGTWYYLKFSFDNGTGYKLEMSEADDKNFEVVWSSETVTRMNPEVAYISFGADCLNSTKTMCPVDLKTVEFKWVDGDGEHLYNFLDYVPLVWYADQHQGTEPDYQRKFIVDRVNEKFRLPLEINRPLENGERLYYFIGDVGQNTSLINLGRMSEALAEKADKSKVVSFKGMQTLFSGVTVGDYTLDLQAYCPYDGHAYDVHCTAYLTNSDTSGNNRQILIYNAEKTQLLDRIEIDGIALPTNGNMRIPLHFPLPVNSRKIVLSIAGTSNQQFSGFVLGLLWLRRY